MDTQPIPRVIVGVDRSIAGLAALRFAATEARRRAVPLHALRIQASIAVGDFTEIDAAFADAFGGWPADLEIHRELLLGPVAEALVRRAVHPGDLLIVGTRGRGWWHACWAGSISRSCLRTARCPVLIVPGPEMARATRYLRLRHSRDVWDRFDRETAPLCG